MTPQPPKTTAKLAICKCGWWLQSPLVTDPSKHMASASIAAGLLPSEGVGIHDVRVIPLAELVVSARSTDTLIDAINAFRKKTWR